MKQLTVAGVLLAALACSPVQAEVTPTYNYNKDVRIGLEAASLGKYSLAQAFLEEALQADASQPWYKAWFKPVLTEESKNAAVKALYEVYWETGQHDRLFDHIHTYNPMPGAFVRLITDSEEINTIYREQLTWYCQMLDKHKHFNDAQECWNAIANSEKSRSSILASEFYEVVLERK